MYKVSEFIKPVYKAGETARIIGVTTETLRNYESVMVEHVTPLYIRRM